MITIPLWLFLLIFAVIWQLSEAQASPPAPRLSPPRVVHHTPPAGSWSTLPGWMRTAILSSQGLLWLLWLLWLSGCLPRVFP